MSWYPEAIRKPVTRYALGGSNHEVMRRPHRVCIHTAVSSGDSLFGLFNTPGNAVAHFYVRESGRIEQYVGTNVRASANLDGNGDMIAIETWDGGKERALNDAQVTAIAELLVWINRRKDRHGVPLRRLPDSRPGRKGVGWHRLGIDGNFPEPDGELLGGRVDGGEHWSTSFGKECPWDVKIKQTVEKVLPMARKIKRHQSIRGTVSRMFKGENSE